MDAVDIVLIALVAVLATALLVTVRARRRDRKLVRSHAEHVETHRQQAVESTSHAERQKAAAHHTRADATEELARERAARQRLEAELHEARARIAELDGQRNGQRDAGTAPAGRFGRG